MPLLKNAVGGRGSSGNRFVHGRFLDSCAIFIQGAGGEVPKNCAAPGAHFSAPLRKSFPRAAFRRMGRFGRIYAL